MAVDLHYGNTDVGVFKRGVQNLKYFCLRINMSKGNFWILRICVVANCQEFGIILVIMWFQNWHYQNISKTKNVLLGIVQWKKWESFEWFLT